MSTIAITTKLATEVCCNCGMLFAMPEDVQNRRVSDHQSFYCPSGHAQSYRGETEEERLRKQLAAKDREIAAAKSRAENERQRRVAAETETQGVVRSLRATRAVVRSLRATRAVVTRTKKKIVAGRCPCCSTKFKDLAVHMKTEHPNYDPEKAAAVLAGKETA